MTMLISLLKFICYLIDDAINVQNAAHGLSVHDIAVKVIG
jgi:hypothetical protein